MISKGTRYTDELIICILKEGVLAFRQCSHIVGIFLSASLVLAVATSFAHAQQVPQTYSFESDDASLVYNEPWILETNESGRMC